MRADARRSRRCVSMAHLVSRASMRVHQRDLCFGSMPRARKGADLRRDPRFALHGPTFHPELGNEKDWPGEAKITGRAIPVGPVTADADGEMFTADITEVVITKLNAEANKLVVESWTPERGLRTVERD